MSEGYLSNDDFFIRLSELFESRRKKDHGTVILTQKRLTSDLEPSSTDPSSTKSTSTSLDPSKTASILIRATNAKSKDKRADKIKLATVVEVDALEGFYGRYAEVCKTGMIGLKKKDRKKQKEKLKARKRKKTGGGEEGKKV